MNKPDALKIIEQRLLWLSHWMIHNANNIRPKEDGIKVGGHQASSASMATIMTALYFYVMRPEDRVAVKPHASPVFHAIQYLLGNQDLDKLKNFRSFGGAQSYPSRTKDKDDVDFSTGSVGLGVAVTGFKPRPEKANSLICVLPRQTAPMAVALRRTVASCSGTRPPLKRLVQMLHGLARLAGLQQFESHFLVLQPLVAVPAEPERPGIRDRHK